MEAKMKKLPVLLAGVLLLMPLGAVYHKIGDYATPLDMQAVVVENGIAYLAEGLYDGTYSILQTLDFSDPLNPFPLGSITLPLDLYDSQRGIDLEVEDGVAFVAHKNAVHALKIVDVSDPLNPSLINSVQIRANDVCLVDSLAYVAADYYGLKIYDVSDPYSIVLLGGLNTPGYTECVTAAGNIAFLGDQNLQGIPPQNIGGLQLIDVSDPQNPVLLGSLDGPFPYSIAVSGTLAIEAGIGVSFIDTYYPEFPIILSSVPGVAYSVTVSDGVAYLAGGGLGMSAIEFSDPQNPSQIGVYAAPGNTMDVQVIGNVAYLAGSAGLQCLDISYPQNTALVASLDTLSTQSFVFSHDLAYVACGSGLQVVDVSAAQNPVLLGSCSMPQFMDAEKIAVADTMAYVAGAFFNPHSWTGNPELDIIDISDPQSPMLTGSLALSNTSYTVGGVAVHDGLAFVAYGSYLKTVDVSVPQNPTYISEWTASGEIRSIAVADNIAYVSTSAGMQVLDISVPQNPSLLGSYAFPADYVSLSGDLAYVAMGSSGVRIIDVSDPATPVLVSSLPPHYATSYIDRCLIRDNRLFISDNNWNEISSYDISAPQTPVLIDRYAWNLSTSDMWVNGNLLYTANGAYGLNIHDLNLVSVDDPVQVPPSVFQMRNYPNPFNPETMISYILPASGKVSLEIFNSRGQLVRSMLHQEQLAGEHSLIWNGKDDSGHSVASGLYLCRIACNGTHETRKMLLLK